MTSNGRIDPVSYMQGQSAAHIAVGNAEVNASRARSAAYEAESEARSARMEAQSAHQAAAAAKLDAESTSRQADQILMALKFVRRQADDWKEEAQAWQDRYERERSGRRGWQESGMAARALIQTLAGVDRDGAEKLIDQSYQENKAAIDASKAGVDEWLFTGVKPAPR